MEELEESQEASRKIPGGRLGQLAMGPLKIHSKKLGVRSGCTLLGRIGGVHNNILKEWITLKEGSDSATFLKLKDRSTSSSKL
jgi:hypothetical protein